MKKLLLAMGIIATASASVQAESVSSLNIGYASAAFKNAPNLDGLEVSYTYQPNKASIGFIASALYAKGNDDLVEAGNKYNVKSSVTSFSVGPLYPVNDSLNLYGTVGITTARADYSVAVGADKVKGNDKENSASVGAGIQYNITETFTTKIGMEKTLSSDLDVLTFVIAGGYRF